MPFAVGSCSVETPSEPEIALSVLAPISQTLPRQSERVFRDVAATVPSFGGFIVDEGQLVVLVADPGQAGAAEQAARQFASVDAELASRSVVVRQTQYSFLQLSRWRDLAFDHVFLGIPGVITLDLDEYRNRVVVGVTHTGLENRVRAVLQSLGMPSRALEVLRASYPESLTDSLHHYVRPIRGGLVVESNDFPNVAYRCTLGFNAIMSGYDVFFTNSHCSDERTGAENDILAYQPELVDVGEDIISAGEYSDPSGWSCGGYTCRYSDASAFLYEDTIDVDYGYLVRVQGSAATGWGNEGPTDIDSSSPRRKIIGAHDSYYGLTLQKTGVTTGATYGDVYETCTDRTPTASLKLVCQDRAELYADSADSGAPVYHLVTDTTVHLVGILWGRNVSDSLGVFSPWSGIENDHGTVHVITSPPLDVDIDGPDYAQANDDQCFWQADVSGGSGMGYEYEWSGVLSGTSSTVSGGIGSSGWLYLDVTDSESNTEGSEIYVTVSGGASPCGI